MTPKTWQEKAKRYVAAVVLLVLGREVRIVFVKNITAKGRDAICHYQVQIESVLAPKELRDKFFRLFPR